MTDVVIDLDAGLSATVDINNIIAEINTSNTDIEVVLSQNDLAVTLETNELTVEISPQEYNVAIQSDIFEIALIVSEIAEVQSVNAYFVYQNSLLTRINYADTSYKLFFYGVNDRLERIDYYKDNVVRTISFSYTQDELTGITYT